jgi:hypothetical protein
MVFCVFLFQSAEGPSTGLKKAVTPGEPPQWYEEVVGILAIPVTLIGAAYSYLLIQKTRVDTRNAQLDIVAKERALGLHSEPVGTAAAEPPTKSATVPIPDIFWSLVLRWILVEFLLRAANPLSSAINFLGKVLGFGVMKLAEALFHINGETVEIVPYVVFGFLGNVFYWLVFVGLVWPLFKDVNAALGIQLRQLRLGNLITEFRRASVSR